MNTCVPLTLDQVFCLYAKSALVDVVFVLVVVIVALTTCPSSSFNPPTSSVASMSSEVLVFIDDKGKPANIPDCATIIKQCFELGPGQATATNISGVRITLEKSSDHDVSHIWVKYGDNVNMGEARTQHFVAQYLQHKNSPAVRAPRLYLAFTWNDCGFIVSEYIYGQECETTPMLPSLPPL